MTIESVLAAVDERDSNRLDRLAGTAADIAGPADATVALAHIFENDEYDEIRADLGSDADSEMTPDDAAKRYKPIRTVGDTLSERGVNFNWHGRLSNETPEGERIVQLAEELDVDLVIVGGKKRSPTGKAIFGSAAQDILLNSPVPVTLVRED